MVDDQHVALRFRTARHGFRKLADIPVGPITAVRFEGTCDNLNHLVQPPARGGR